MAEAEQVKEDKPAALSQDLDQVILSKTVEAMVEKRVKQWEEEQARKKPKQEDQSERRNRPGQRQRQK